MSAKAIARKRSAFTMIELLVVVSILALLLAILIPSMRGASREAKRAACASNLRSLGQAMRMYFSDNNDLIPIVIRQPSLPFDDVQASWPTIAETLGPYLDGHSAVPGDADSVFQCPADYPGATSRPDPNTGKSFFQTEQSSYEFRTTLYKLMFDEFQFPPDLTKLKQTSLTNIMNHERLRDQYNGKISESEFWLLKDYVAFHKGEGANRAINYLYADGHVADLER